MANKLANYDDGSKFTEDLIISYFNTSFTVVVLSALLKILGISKASWLLITALIWVPPAAILALVGMTSVCIYIGFVVCLLGNFCLTQVLKLKKLFSR